MYEAQLAQTMMQADMGVSNQYQSPYQGEDGASASNEGMQRSEMEGTNNEQAFYEMQ